MTRPESSPPENLKQRVAKAAIPFSRFLFRYLTPSFGLRKVFWHRFLGPRLAWREHNAVASVRFGAKFAVTTNDVIHSKIYFFGFWEPHVAALIMARVHSGDTFVDVGANIGYFSVLASRIVGPTGRVVSVEASSRIFSHLSDSISRNGCSNIRAVHGAAGDRRETVEFFLPDKGDENCGLGSMIRETKEFEVVQCDRLDNWLTEDEIRSARFIKIDVEGAETMVLAGMAEMLPQLPPTAEILAEISPGLSDVPELFKLLETHGFHAWALPVDTFDDYIRGPASFSLTPVSLPLARRIDVLFTRAPVGEIPAFAA